MGVVAEIAEVFAEFELDGRITGIQPIEVGHIHKSFRVDTTAGVWFVQQINHLVFKNVEGMMDNIRLVTDMQVTQAALRGFEALQLVPTRAGKSYLLHNGNSWRMYDFKTHLKGHDQPAFPAMVGEAAKAFATFVEMLSALAPNQLVVTIPKFHSLAHRIDQLANAKASTKLDVALYENELDRIAQYAAICQTLENAWKEGSLPTRIVHNDTKFNNLLFDHTGIAKCVIDLDTVMPGIVHFDVGDCLRTLACTTVEDEADLSKISVNEDYYRAFIADYISAGSWLCEEEIALLPLAAPYMALIMAVRFMTDHLNGDVYFHCKYPGHNLVRARAQLTLSGKFLALEGLMEFEGL